MRPVRASWKIIGLAGLAGVATTGVIVARKRRVHRHYDSDELRQRLHERLAEASNSGHSSPEPPPGSRGSPGPAHA
jgi:hypothetical protein